MGDSINLVSKSLDDTKMIAHKIVEDFILGKNRCVVFLKGDLGSGKTTFVRFALEKLGVKEDKFNGSPTFTIVNEYGNVFHIDLYRLKSKEDVFDSGIDEYLSKDGVFFVEWPEILDMKPDILIEFLDIGDKEREIHVYSG